MSPALVERAAAELFEEGFLSSEIRRTLDNTDPELRPQAYESMRLKRSVPDGCFDFVYHLVWLEKVIEIAPALSLTAAEAEGLLVLKRERIRFQNAHPPCPNCGMPNEVHAFHCRECNAEIKH